MRSAPWSSIASLSIVLLIAADAGGRVAHGAEPVDRLAIHDAPQPVPNLSFEDAAGTTRHLSDFKGRTVLLNLWATWCVPCRHEIPTLDHLQESLGGAQFEVVALSIDRGGAKLVEPFFRDRGLKHLALYIDRTGGGARAVGAVGIPTTLLIDRAGREVGRAAGALEWDSAAVIDQIRQTIDDHPTDQEVTKGGGS